MKLRAFELERWLTRRSCRYDLAGAAVKCLDLWELVAQFDSLELGYGSSNGSEELRNGVSALYSNVGRDEVLITNGAAEANLLTLTYLLDKGDEVVFGGVPTYLQNARLAEALGARIKYFCLDEKKGYRTNIDALNEIVTRKTKMLIFINPNNPAGSRFSSREIRAICEIAESVDAYVVADEALRNTEIDGIPSATPVEVYDKGISTGSLSKLGLAGLRTGWVVADKDLIGELWAQKDYTTLANPVLSDYVSTIVLENDNIHRIIQRAGKILRKNLQVLSKWLRKSRLLLRCTLPLAGATAFPRF